MKSELGSTDLEFGPVASFCERGSETSGAIKTENVLTSWVLLFQKVICTEEFDNYLCAFSCICYSH